MIISVFTPHGGCPERCSFCDQKVSGGEAVAVSKITQTIEAHLSTRKDNAPAELAFYGGTFTAFSPELQLRYLSAVIPYLEKGLIDRVRVSTRPDAVEKNWLKRLRDEFALRTVELGVQSFDQNVLKALGRSHSVESVFRARETLAELGLEASFHLMVGCPGENPAAADEQALAGLAKARPEMARFHPLLVLKGTLLERRWRENAFAPLGLENAITRLASLVDGTEGLGIRVIRIGLQPNELLGEAVLAGAYHPSLGELVRARMVALKLFRSRPELAKETRLEETLETSLNSASWQLLLSHNRAALCWLEGQFKAVL